MSHVVFRLQVNEVEPGTYQAELLTWEGQTLVQARSVDVAGLGAAWAIREWVLEEWATFCWPRLPLDIQGGL